MTIENLARAAFLYILRIIQKSRGDFDAAKVALNAALTLSPQFAEAWNGLVADDYSTIVDIGKISPMWKHARHGPHLTLGCLMTGMERLAEVKP